MKKSDLIRANIENLKEEAKELVNKTDATLEDLNAIDNKIAVEEKKLEIQLKNEAKERAAASEGATNLPEATAGVTEENKIDNKERNRVLALAICGKASQSDLAKISNLLQEGEDSKGGLLVPP
ncbi:phage major capsid protein, partial [Cetobacterium sp.]